MTHLAELMDGGSPPAVDYCDPKITSAVDEAYEAVWAIIQNSDPRTVRRRNAKERRT